MKFNKTVLSIILVAGLTFMLFISLRFLLSIHIVYLVILRITIIILDLIFATLVLWHVNNLIKGKKKILFNMGVFLYALFCCFLVAEGVFMFVPQSHGTGYTYGHFNWMIYFWHPYNSLGYRDVEYNQSKIQNKIVITFLGDSFTAGAGIRSVNDRFSNIVQSRMPDEYAIINLGYSGSDTRDAFKRLKKHPIKPDILIYQYFIDDIAGAALSKGMKHPPFIPYINIPSIIRPIVEYSYFIDFLYWRFPQQDDSLYLRFNFAAHKDSRVLKEHYRDLNSIISYCKSKQIQLIVVLFPLLQAPEISETLLNPIEKLFYNRGIPVINMVNFISKLPLRKRIVSLNDPHPSKMVHNMIANKLYVLLKKSKHKFNK